MLVLERRRGQSVTMKIAGVEIVVSVERLVDWEGHRKVRLGFEAPREVEILRTEIITKEINDEQRHS